MEQFYKIVIIIAIVFLILFLTIIGIILYSKNNSQVYPPTKNDCPDYWNADDSDPPKCQINPVNIGDISNFQGTPGYNNGLINFSDSGWASQYKTTNICALNKWTTQHKISWDGVSNYNGC